MVGIRTQNEKYNLYGTRQLSGQFESVMRDIQSKRADIKPRALGTKLADERKLIPYKQNVEHG